MQQVGKTKVDNDRLALWGVVLALEAGLLLVSQTVAGYRDEGLHLMAAQLINAGRRPYLDFFFQHPPLYAYLNAACLQIFGSNWRGPHALSALLTGAAILLAAQFVHSRISTPAWRLPGASAAAVLIGANTLVVRFGTISQPYAGCLFFGVASFRLIVAAAESPMGLISFCAGVAAGAAAASSFLASPIVLIMLVWLIWRTRAGKRLKRSAQFLAGCAVPLLPLLWLAAEGPRQVLFDLVQFHLFHRARAFVPSAGLFRWDLDVLSGFLRSTQGLVLLGLGVYCIAEAGKWEKGLRAELHLCVWLAAGLAILAAITRPTFAQYFVALTPFLSILAAFGLYSLGSSLWPARSPGWVVLGLAALFCLHIYQLRSVFYPCWRQIETVAHAIDEVTPRNEDFYADYESVYFAAGRVPPPGQENAFAPELHLPDALAASLRVVPQAQIDNRMAAGKFAAVLIWTGHPAIESLGLRRIYRKEREVTCYNIRHYLFWDRASPL